MILVVAGICITDDRVLLTQRPAGKHLAGLWEFPGGKMDPGETPEQALVREFQEELAVGVRDIAPYTFAHHRYQADDHEKEILLLFFTCRLAGTPVAQEDNPVRWVPLADLGSIDMPEADRDLVRQLTRQR